MLGSNFAPCWVERVSPLSCCGLHSPHPARARGVAWLVTVPGRGVRSGGVARLRLGQAGGTGSAREYAAAAARVLARGNAPLCRAGIAAPAAGRCWLRSWDRLSFWELRLSLAQRPALRLSS